MILIDKSFPINYDELLEDAINICIQYDRASAALLQRRLSIGYARAARLIDQLESIDILGKFEGTGIPRKVLVSKAKQFDKGRVNREGSKENLIVSAELIKQTLLAHGIQIRVNSISVTTKHICFFAEVAVGTELDSLLKLHKELAMILASRTGKVEIVAPFKGTSMVAIYLPTKKDLDKADYKVINSNFELRPPANAFLHAIRIKIRGLLLQFSNFIYILAYKI